MEKQLHLLLRIVSKVRDYLLYPYGWTKSQLQRIVPASIEQDYPIDFVVTWVDGEDCDWQMRKASYAGEITEEMENTPARYRDWGLMRYWFRAVEQYAPWVRKVFFVTCGHKPEWLDLNNEKLVFVTHKDFIPEQYLPTFNSRTIEMNLWRIRDLSEHFVYFNDDVFLNRPVTPEFFYEQGLPKLCSLAIPFCFRIPASNTIWKLSLLNDIEIINDTFDIRKAVRNHPEKFFSYVYGRKAKYNWRILDDSFITGMYYPHTSFAYLKSTFAEIWNAHHDIMDASCKYRFRNRNQVTVLLPLLWMIFRGQYVPVDTGYYGRSIGLDHKSINRIDELLQSSDGIVCLNDNQFTDSEDEETKLMIYKELHKAFSKKFPNKSVFELK